MKVVEFQWIDFSLITIEEIHGLNHSDQFDINWFVFYALNSVVILA